MEISKISLKNYLPFEIPFSPCFITISILFKSFKSFSCFLLNRPPITPFFLGLMKSASANKPFFSSLIVIPVTNLQTVFFFKAPSNSLFLKMLINYKLQVRIGHNIFSPIFEININRVYLSSSHISRVNPSHSNFELKLINKSYSTSQWV